mgnify:CR=1 FL=1
MPGYAKKILKKYKEGGKVSEYKDDLEKEVKGMGPEGKRYLEDELEDKQYKGKLKEKYQKDLEKEMYGMSGPGKEELKKLLEEEKKKDDKMVEKNWSKASQSSQKLKDLSKDLQGKTLGELMAYSEKGYAKGGAIHTPVKAEPKDILRTKKNKNWIQGAVKKPGALRATAKKEGLIEGDEKLSASDLKKLAAQASKKDNKLLAKRVALAKTFAKMRKK